MAENTAIEWATHTFNPWVGCSKVSEGCRHCYAEKLMDLRYGKVTWGPDGRRSRTSRENWNKVRTWDRKAKAAGVRHRVFCASLADIFEDHPSIDIQWRVDLFELIDLCRNLDWLLLTKRPQNVRPYVRKATGREPWAWFRDCDHVWVGTSVENQDAADERIPLLLDVPASVRFLSCEPLVGPVKFKRLDGIHWVIAGGESGDKARPMYPTWPRSIRDQCVAAEVPFLFKQWGEWLPFIDPRDTDEWPTTRFDKVGKKIAGRVLDGRTWDEVPR